MNNYGKKLRSTITDNMELEILLLKQVTRATLVCGRCVSYADRYMLHPSDTGYYLTKSEDPSAFVEFFEKQESQATDHFLEQFIREATCNLDEVIFCSSLDGPGVPWSTIKANYSISTLLDPHVLDARLSRSIFTHTEIVEELDEPAEAGDNL